MYRINNDHNLKMTKDSLMYVDQVFDSEKPKYEGLEYCDDILINAHKYKMIHKDIGKSFSQTLPECTPSVS